MLSKVIQKIWRGNRPQNPRWRDDKGNFVGWSRLLRNGTRAGATGFLRLAFDVRPALPWISYDSIQVLQKHLGPKSRVLEFGSGMSTVWYAQHAAEVYSVDDYQPWYAKVQEILKRRGIKNVVYELASKPEDYIRFGKQANKPFDLIMVDGSHRADCIRHSLELLAEGGIIYLDNSDKDAEGLGDEFRQAEALLTEYAAKNNCEVKFFTDFAPTQLFVQQGMLVKRK